MINTIIHSIQMTMLCTKIRFLHILAVIALLSFFSFPLIFLGVGLFFSIPSGVTSGVAVCSISIGLLPLHLLAIEYTHICFKTSEIITKKYFFKKKRYRYTDLKLYSFYQYYRNGFVQPKREEGIYFLFQDKKIYSVDKANIANYQKIRNHITTHFSKEKEGNIDYRHSFVVWIVHVVIAFGGGGLLVFLFK